MKARFKTPTRVQLANWRGSKEKIVGNNGELNASSKADLLKRLVELAEMVNSGEVDVDSPEPEKINQKEKEKIITAAYADRTGSSWTELGSSMAANVKETADREGFMRRLLVKGDLSQGNKPLVRVQVKNVTAIVAASESHHYPQMLRDKEIYPPEFTVKTNIRINEIELAQRPTDIMEEKFFESQEAIMVGEDRTWKRMVDQTVGLQNDLSYLAGGLTPSTLSFLQQQVNRWGLQASNALVTSEIIQDLQGNSSFGAWFDPVSKLELIQTGLVGTLLGMSVMTDSFRHPNLKVLEPGEIYVTSTPETHGTYTDRGPVQSQDVNSYNDGIPARGWFMYEILSMVIHNARSVAKGVRS
jgi:hypothetical protein